MTFPPRWRRLHAAFLASLLAACALAGSPAVQAQQADKSLLLVAAPTLRGAYQQTTLVAVPVDGTYIGFILNRATKFKLSVLLPEHAPAAKVADPVYFGGPENLQALFAAVRSDPGKQSLRLLADLYVTGKAEAIHRIIEQTPNEARYFAGFVGWLPGELEGEIARGHWYVAEPESGLVFRQDTGGMWEELVARLDGQRPPPRRRHLLQTVFQPLE